MLHGHFLDKDWCGIEAPPSVVSVTKDAGSHTSVSAVEWPGSRRDDEEQARNYVPDVGVMLLTPAKLRSVVRKPRSIIEAHIDITTTDGCLVCRFVVDVVERRRDQASTNCCVQLA